MKLVLTAGILLMLWSSLAAAQQRKPDAVRTLTDINIEGEIAVPQVLFITSRDYPRFRDGLGKQLRMTSLDVARSINVPTRLRVIARAQHMQEDKP